MKCPYRTGTHLGTILTVYGPTSGGHIILAPPAPLIETRAGAYLLKQPALVLLISIGLRAYGVNEPCLAFRCWTWLRDVQTGQ